MDSHVDKTTSPAADTLPVQSAGCAPLPEIDGYDLLAQVGRGGMGAVYEALQRATGARVAIKFMIAPPGAADSMRRRFEREVDLIARLQHPHIVRLLDSGVQRGHYYYVMEYVDGSTPLDAFPCRAAAPPPAAIELMEKICAAVDFAHQHGVLHRDLKPSNILVDSRGDPHLLDFGLAKSIDPGSGQWLDATLSEPGQLLGTLGYMSPEHCRGERVGSVRCDVYSLGAIAYELFTGRLPSAIDGPLSQVLARIETIDPLRPSSLSPALRGDMDAILLKALAKEPGRRYATAAELAADLRRHRLHEPIAARRASLALRVQRWIERNRAVAAVGAVALLALLTVGAYSVIRIVRERDRALANEKLAREKLRFSLEAIDSLVFDTDQRLEGMLGVSDVRRKLLDVALRFYEQLPQDSARLGLEGLTAPQYGRLGDALYARGERDAAARYYRESLLELQRGSGAAPSAGAPAREIAIAWQRIGSIEPNAADARASLARALDVFVERARLNPRDATAAADVADAHMRIAEHDAADAAAAKIAESVRAAIDAQGTAHSLAHAGAADRADVDVSRLQMRIVVVLKAADNRDAVMRACDETAEFAEALPTRFPDSVDAHGQALAAMCRVADTWMEMGELDRAAMLLLIARRAAETAMQRWPRDMNMRGMAAAVLSTCGNLAVRRAAYAEAIAAYERARELMGQAFELQPSETRYRERYANALTALGGVHALQRNWSVAADFYDQFLRVSEPLAREDPAHVPARAYAWHVVGDQRAKDAAVETARRCYESGLAELAAFAQENSLDDYAADLQAGLNAAIAALPATSQPTP